MALEFLGTWTCKDRTVAGPLFQVPWEASSQGCCGHHHSNKRARSNNASRSSCDESSLSSSNDGGQQHGRHTYCRPPHMECIGPFEGTATHATTPQPHERNVVYETENAACAPRLLLNRRLDDEESRISGDASSPCSSDSSGLCSSSGHDSDEGTEEVGCGGGSAGLLEEAGRAAELMHAAALQLPAGSFVAGVLLPADIGEALHAAGENAHSSGPGHQSPAADVLAAHPRSTRASPTYVERRPCSSGSQVQQRPCLFPNATAAPNEEADPSRLLPDGKLAVKRDGNCLSRRGELIKWADPGAEARGPAHTHARAHAGGHAHDHDHVGRPAAAAAVLDHDRDGVGNAGRLGSGSSSRPRIKTEAPPDPDLFGTNSHRIGPNPDILGSSCPQVKTKVADSHEQTASQARHHVPGHVLATGDPRRQPPGGSGHLPRSELPWPPPARADESGVGPVHHRVLGTGVVPAQRLQAAGNMPAQRVQGDCARPVKGEQGAEELPAAAALPATWIWKQPGPGPSRAQRSSIGRLWKKLPK